MRAICVLVLLVGTLGTAQEKNEPVPRVLHVSSEHAWAATTFGWYDFVKSDGDGNLFFHADKGSYNDGTILRVTARNGSPTLYEMPRELRNAAYFVSFNVTDDGSVAVLYRDTKTRHLLVRYDGAGVANDPIVTDLPLHLNVQDFATFESGEFLINGFFEAEAEESVRGHGYAALFGNTGQLVRRLDQVTEDVDLAHVFDGVHQGTATSGDDGNLYLLSSSHVLCISPTGKVVRRIRVPKASKDFLPLQLFVSAGRLAIVQHRVRKQDVNEILIQVVDSRTGELYTTYKPEPKLGNMVVSFSSTEGFTFLDGATGHFTTMFAALD
jgi:hypothetical protein